MITIFTIYALGVILTNFYYKKHYEMTIPITEILLTWFYHLPIMVIRHVKFSRQEKKLMNKRVELKTKEFWKAYSIASSQNWSETDWQQWNTRIDYELQFLR